MQEVAEKRRQTFWYGHYMLSTASNFVLHIWMIHRSGISNSHINQRYFSAVSSIYHSRTCQKLLMRRQSYEIELMNPPKHYMAVAVNILIIRLFCFCCTLKIWLRPLDSTETTLEKLCLQTGRQESRRWTSVRHETALLTFNSTPSVAMRTRQDEPRCSIRQDTMY
jgi:hypothetical protein